MKSLNYIFRLALLTILFNLYFNGSIYAQSNPCDSAPNEYKEYCNQANTWLDTKLIEWKPAEYNLMNFGVYHVYASDNMFVKTNADTDIKILNAIEGVNPNTVVLYVRPSSYFSQKERYDALISKIRQDGKKLFIGARFDDVEMDFKSYDDSLVDYTKNIIAVIKPDYFGIVIEPATMEQKYNFNVTDEQWVGLVDKIAKLSKQLIPDTKTFADGHKEELNFLKLVSEINDVDIIGFNIYGAEGIYHEYSGYLGEGDVVGDAIDFVNSKGKETWILETWTSAMLNEEQSDRSVKDFMKPIDAKWIQVITYYAQKHSMKAVVPFYTGKFVYYGMDPVEFKSALDSGQRTAPFYAYKDVINEFKLHTNIEESDSNVPTRFELYQNYPNPFNPTTTINFSLPHREYLTLKIFDVLGREMALLVNGELNAGEHSVVFNAKNVASGVYFYQIQAGPMARQKAMLVLK